MTESPSIPKARPRSPRRRAFAVGRALSDTFSIWFGNLVPFALLTLVIFAPYMVLNYFSSVLVADFTMVVWWDAVDTAVMWLCGSVLTAAMIHTVFQHLRGQKVGFGESVARGLPMLLGVVGVSLLYAAIMVLPLLPSMGLMATGSRTAGAVAMVIGVVFTYIVNCGLYVAVPAYVIERVGALQALKRSWFLTRGSKPQIFLLIIIFALTVGLGAGIVAGVTSALSEGFDESAALSVGTFLGTLLFVLLSASLQAVLSTVIYHDLRMMKEGIGAEDLADVFA